MWVWLVSRGPYRNSAATRAAILEAIRACPGATRSDILRLTGISWGAAAHHVRHMVSRGEILSHTHGRRTYFSLAGVEPGLLPFLRLLRDEPEIAQLLAILNRNGPASVLRLSRELRVNRKTVRRHISILEGAGYVGLSGLARPRFELKALPLWIRSRLP